MVATMIGVTLRMLALERNEQRQALSAESERLALWRMESQLLPLVLEESARNFQSPQFQSSVLKSPPAEVRCYFRCDSSGNVEILEAADDDSGQKVPSAASSDMQTLIAGDLRNPLFMSTLEESSAPAETLIADNEQVSPSQLNQQAQVEERNQETSQVSQIVRSQNEFQNRMANNTEFQRQYLGQGLRVNGMNYFASNGPNPMTAFWIDRHLYLARELENGNVRQAEGCLLDWNQLKPVLLESIRDLLPDADLEPLPPDEPGDHLTVATLPLRLIPGEPRLNNLPVSSALKPTLTVAWSCFLLSAAALGVMLFGVVRLSERRAAFVSAVTHELRTPLTTFRLYSDLLADREALSEEKYDRYIDTLKNEAERLEYLVENVLSWSRLERSAETQLIEDIDWNDLYERIESSLQERAAQAGMELEYSLQEDNAPILIRGNRTAIERILFNLIDNACKYAGSSDDNRLEIDLSANDRKVSINIRDHGPGISDEVRLRLFWPFTKSAEEAARSAPGIGLGLSLSRRLARDMQGDLRLVESSSSGSTFELRLPRGI
jgi:signal transduction histidine kinase